jgi:hypothetical protein
MSLREIGEDGSVREMSGLDHQREFDQVWLSITLQHRTAIEVEINCRLDELVASPDPNWGAITNTSIEGGKTNPNTGVRGDWSETVFQPIFIACGLNHERAGMFFGNVWKKVIMDRPEGWVGIRSDPTFPQRGITLQGKTYFLDRQ